MKKCLSLNNINLRSKVFHCAAILVIFSFLECYPEPRNSHIRPLMNFSSQVSIEGLSANGPLRKVTLDLPKNIEQSLIDKTSLSEPYGDFCKILVDIEFRRLPLFPSEFPVAIDDDDDYVPSGLVPINRVKYGDTAIIAWKQAADNGTQFCDNTGKCNGIFYGKSKQQTYAQILLYCSYSRVSDRYGSPEECEPLAFLTNREQLIASTYRLRETGNCHHSMGRLAHRIKIINANSLKSKLTSNQIGVIDLILQVLRAPPLSLETQLVDFGLGPIRFSDSDKIIIEGTSSMRPSAVLPGNWREMATVRVDVFAREAQNRLQEIDQELQDQHGSVNSPEENASILIDIATTLYLSKVNSENPSEWHLPTQQQSILYDNIVTKLIRKSLAQACSIEKTRETLNTSLLKCKP